MKPLITSQVDMITVAILAKDKAHMLPFYLEAIENQTYPAAKIKLYIRTNNNRDQTEEILREWIEKVKDRYSEIHFDSSVINEPIEDYAPHDWNPMRLDIIGRIRKASTEWARERNTHYFVADCDNVIAPETIETLFHTNLPVVGPLLRVMEDPNTEYSNYHYVVTEDGYYRESPLYQEVLYQRVKGLIEVEVIHCTYFIRNEVLDHVEYFDGSGRFEYVIFSETLRKAGIPQYIDNRHIYGKLTFCDSLKDFEDKGVDVESLRQISQTMF